MKTSLSSPMLDGSLMAIEIDLETQANREGAAKYDRLCESAISRRDGAKLKPVEKMIVGWWPEYVQAIKQETRACKLGVAGVGRMVYGQVLSVCNSKATACVALHEIISACLIEPMGAPMRQVSYAVGSAVIAEMHLTVMKNRKVTPKELVKILEESGKNKSRQVNKFAKKSMEDHQWDRRMCSHLGLCLIWKLVGVSMLKRVEKVPGEENKIVMERALVCKRRFRDGKGTNMLVLSDYAMNTLEEAQFLRRTLRPRFQPMVAPPLPWGRDKNGDIEEGGHYRLRTPFVVKPTNSLRARLAKTDLTKVFEGLNAISKTPWKIDTKIKEIVSQLMDQGGNTAGLPRLNPIKIPDRPKTPKLEDPENHKIWARAARDAYERNEQDGSARSDLIMALGIADRMSKYDAIWFPHQYDFRGRAYPVPLHLNHMSSDSRRAMLLFAEAKPGYDEKYLKIHAANCWGNGVDKYDHALRVGWANANTFSIEKFASDPFKHDGWMQADDPFQFLQSCMGLCDIKIGSRIPIKLDGSANGLQHLSAMGLDSTGGESVNLTKSDAPKDIYTDVAIVVREMIEDLASKGDPIAQQLMPFVVTCGLNKARKVVKQPVMTSVYGCTRTGARDQMQPRLVENGMPKAEAAKAAHWLAGIVMQAIGVQCRAGSGIMKWLREATKQILNDDPHRVIEWISPMGFPVVQPYWSLKKITIKTHLNTIHLQMPNEQGRQNIGRNRNGISPNVVHAADASHMIQTAIECQKQGIEYAAVHDSYWTHAATVPQLSFILRDEFVKLHSTPHLEQMREFWQTKYSVVLPPLPETGDLDLQGIYKSEYFFS